MSSFLVALSTRHRILATIVVFIGYDLLTSRIYLPVFERQMQANTLRDLLEQVSSRLRPFLGGSLLSFVSTGVHLMLVNAIVCTEQYSRH
jgi:hypothetical protein